MSIKRGNLLKIILGCVLFLSVALCGLTAGVFTVRATGNFTVSGMTYNSKKNEMYEFYLTVSGYTPTSNSWSSYMKENDSSVNVPDKIEINGKTVSELNTEYRTAAAEWTFNMFPANSGGYYEKMPVLLKGSSGAGSIVLYIHENLYNLAIAESGKVSVQAKSGLVAEGNTLSEDSAMYEVVNENGVPKSVKVAPQVVDITESTTVGGWIHQDNELRVFNVNLGTGVMPSGINYGVMDNDAYKYIAEYITVNGKTIKAINEETDVSGYEFHVFPSSADDKYKVPVMVFVNGDDIQVKLHDTYYATLGGELNVSVLEGLVIVNGSTEYEVGGTVSYFRKSGQWFDLNHEYTITYYVNGELYATEYYKLSDTIEMLAAPDTENGYEFGGWDKQITKITDGDEEINGYITPIRYTITYNLDGGENSSLNPVRYTIESDEITLKDAVKEGYTFDGWFNANGEKTEKIQTGSYGNITLNARFTKVAGDGCSSGISGGYIGFTALLLCAAAVLLIVRAAKKTVN